MLARDTPSPDATSGRTLLPRPAPVRDPAPVRGPRLNLLKGFELRANSDVVSLPVSAQRLVAFLALQERPLHRVYVAGTLWGNRDDRRAGTSLRTCYGASSVRRRSDRRHEHAPEAGDGRRRRRLPGRCARARCVLADVPSDRRDVRALSLAGDLLPDWYDDWVLIEQEQIRQLRLHTLESLDGLAGRESRRGPQRG